MRKLTLSILFVFGALALYSQDEMAPGATYRSFTPADMWELGVDLGPAFISGDLDSKIGFGGGLHVRKALDHIFSIRVGGMYASASNEDGNRTSETTWISGSGQLVVALNNFRFNKPHRKVLVNGILGLGVNQFTTDFTNVLQIDNSTNGTIDEGIAGHIEVGAGLAFRVSPKFNIGLEYTVANVLGGTSDLLDADQNVNATRTTFRDFMHFPHLSLNFNLGKDKSEPLYWANPLGQVSDAISALEARPIYDPTDTDGDGIIDSIDEEDDSPAGARVDSRGVTLDSDGDKVPDYKDKEPYSPPGYTVDKDGVANVPKPNWVTEDDVNRIVDAKLAAFKVPSRGLADWFLPLVNFDLNSYTVKRAEYEKMYQIAMVIKNNPEARFVVTGNADRSGSEAYNNVLSYNRAKSAIEFLVNQHGVSRSQLVLNYAGEGKAIIDTNSANYTNRRCEFRVAKDGESDMARPEGPEAGTGRFEGNKSGY